MKKSELVKLIKEEIKFYEAEGKKEGEGDSKLQEYLDELKEFSDSISTSVDSLSDNADAIENKNDVTNSDKMNKVNQEQVDNILKNIRVNVKGLVTVYKEFLKYKEKKYKKDEKKYIKKNNFRRNSKVKRKLI